MLVCSNLENSIGIALGFVEASFGAEFLDSFGSLSEALSAYRDVLMIMVVCISERGLILGGI